MSNKRRSLLLSLLMILMLGLAPALWADETADTAAAEIVLTIDSLVVRQGDTILPEPPIAPQIINGRTMLPFRYLIQELLGGSVEWTEETRSIKAEINGWTIAMTIDEEMIEITSPVLGGFDAAMSHASVESYGQAPVVIDGYTLVPLRAFESVVSAITWQEESRGVHIAPFLLNREQLLIPFESNGSTGYSWSFTADAEGIVEEINDGAYVDEPVEGDETMVGAPGRQEFIFTGLKPGTVRLTFSYARSWEADEEPAEVRVFDILVAADYSMSYREVEGEVTPVIDEPTASESYTLSLPSNASTGYSWSFTADTEGIVEETNDGAYIDEPVEGDEPLVGAPGRQEFIFTGVEPGTVRLTFVYARNSDEDEEPAEVRIFDIDVAADFTMSCSEVEADPEPSEKNYLSFPFRSNPSTGYAWQYTFSEIGIIQEADYDYEQDPQYEEDIAGAPGTTTIYFEALKPGQVDIVFVYTQSWVPHQNAWVEIYRVVVDEDLNMECEEIAREDADVLTGSLAILPIALPLQEDASEDIAWSFSLAEEGIVEEIAYDDLPHPEEYEDGSIELLFIPAADSTIFFFKGLEPGEVTISFTYASTKDKKAKALDSAEITVVVNEDLSLEIVPD